MIDFVRNFVVQKMRPLRVSLITFKCQSIDQKRDEIFLYSYSYSRIPFYHTNVSARGTL